MASISNMIALLAVAFALFASFASAQCAIQNCNNCAMDNPNVCLACDAGYSLNANGACVAIPSGTLAPQSMAVAALVVLASLLSYVM